MNWSFFDRIYCINLFTRTDRLEKSKEIFNKLEIPVEYYRVHKHLTDGARGCFESHISIIKKAYYEGCKNVLIFEDDIIESPYFSNLLIKKSIEFLKITDWELFYFGHQPNILTNSTTVISPNIIKTQSTLTHSYAISRKYMKKLINITYEDIPIDKIYLKNNKSYALYPMAFYQDDSKSDIVTSAPITNLHFFESYAYYINYSIIELIILIVLIFVFTTLIFFKK